MSFCSSEKLRHVLAGQGHPDSEIQVEQFGKNRKDY